MRAISGKEFHSSDFQYHDSCAVFCDIEFRRCHFQGCYLSMDTVPSRRTTVRNVSLVSCAQRGCGIGSPIVENVLVDSLDTGGQLLQSFGAVFNGVVFRGNCGRVMISNDVFPSLLLSDESREMQIKAFRKANSDYYSDVDWALDIRQAEFKELSLRGVPAALVRRDPDTQFVVKRENAIGRQWVELPFRENLWPTSLDLFLNRDEPSIVLVAPKRHPKFKRYLEDLRMLRGACVADPD